MKIVLILRQELSCYVFFKICPRIFMILSQIGVAILVTPKQEMEWKSE